MSKFAEQKRYKAFLFDMDGTILNSKAAAERVWGKWAALHGLDVAAFLPTMHGARSIDTISRLKLPGVDAAAEARGIEKAEIVDVEGVLEIPGAGKFLRSLPTGRWAIATSAPLALASVRLKAAGLPFPSVMITAEDVSAGKPNPACYLMAAQKLGFAPEDCLVFEDAPVGIQAAEAVGGGVMVVTSTHTHTQAMPHETINDYNDIRVAVGAQDFLQLEKQREKRS